jgi:hypothetical protein
MDETTTDAEALNDALDERFARGRQSTALPAGFGLLVRADSTTPDPDAQFAKALRATLLAEASGRPGRRAPNQLGTHLGIVAAPIGIPREFRQFRRVVTPFAIAVALLLALFAFNTGWSDGGHQAFGVPTAQASTTVVPATPTPTATFAIQPGDSLESRHTAR